MSILTKIPAKQRRIGTHVIFWAFYVVFFGSVYGKYGQNFQWYFIESLSMLPFVMAATYTTIYVILPFYIRTRKLFLSVVSIVAVLLLATVGERLFLRLINGLPLTSDSVLGITFLYLFLETNFMVAIAFAIKIVKKWLQQQEEGHETEKQYLKKELSLLKAQLQPHFLFNTMNNLYSLSLEKSAKTSEGIAQMADLLQAVLYECNEAEIPLQKEIKLINDYMELERLRHGDHLDWKFEVTGEWLQWNIAPMLLFTFVENCFKHGGRLADEIFFIHIDLAVSEEKICFKTENSVMQTRQPSKDKAGGVGLDNARKRLNIIYPDRYRLSIGEKGEIWKVHLEIQK